MKKWKQYFTDLSKQPGAVAVDVAHTPIRESLPLWLKRKLPQPSQAVWMRQ